MTRKNDQQNVPELKALMTQNADLLQPLVQWLLQQVLEQEMSDSLGAAKGERTEGRQGCRSGYHPRQLVTRVGTMELRVPQDRQGRFSTQLFERHQRSGDGPPDPAPRNCGQIAKGRSLCPKGSTGGCWQMDVQGVSTRRNKTITGELCGHGFSASAISGMNVKLDGELERFARRTLEQRCCVHFLRNALGHLPRKAGDDCRSGDLQSALRENGRRCRATQCLTELRWLHDRRDAAEARVHLAAWLER